jgi:hypothetical protein
MARDPKRQTTKLPFMGKPIEFYRPTSGQATALVLSSRMGGTDAVVRYFQVLELLTVRPADWKHMEGKLISGAADVDVYADILTDLVSRDWDEPPAGDDVVPAE